MFAKTTPRYRLTNARKCPRDFIGKGVFFRGQNFLRPKSVLPKPGARVETSQNDPTFQVSELSFAQIFVKLLLS